MVVCQYFLRGTCRFGTACRNEHPANPGRSAFGNQSWPNTTPNVQSPTRQTTALFTQESLKLDLTSDKPIWPLSTFGPAKFEPNLISNLDESMEELRLKAVMALKAGNVNEYTTYEAKRIEAANETYNNARNNLAQVYQTALSQSTRPAPSSTTTTTSPFTSSTTTTTPTTNPSTFSSPLKPNPFTAPTFGQSTFGVKPTTTSSPQSVFGQTSTLGGNKPGAGGGTTTGGGFGAFASGGTSSLASAAAAMKSPAQSGSGGGAFASFAGGQPSVFGAGAANSGGSVFGTGGPLGGGAPSTVFGQQQQPQQTTSAFGTIQNTPTSVFGQTQQTQQPQQPQQGGGFGVFSNQQPQQPQSVFGGGGTAAPPPQQQQQQQQQSPQTQSSFGNPTQQPQSAFGAPPQQQQQPQQQQGQSAFGASQSVFGTTSAQPQSVFGVAGGGGGGGGNPLNPPSVFSTSSNPFNVSTSSPQQPQPSPFNQPSPFTNSTNTFPSNPPSNPPPTTTLPPPNPPQPTNQNLLTNPTSKPNFLALLSRTRATPGKSPYDKTLPPNYGELLPKHVLEAFRRERFEFGMVPEWVPPVEMR